MSPYIKYLPLPTILTLTSWTALVHNVKFQNKPRGLYFFQRPFLRGLFLEGLIFGGSCPRREICFSKSIGLAHSWKEIYRFCFVLLCIWVQAPRGLYFEGRFYGEFFALPVRGAYLERLIHGGAYFRNFTVFVPRWVTLSEKSQEAHTVCVCVFVLFFK